MRDFSKVSPTLWQSSRFMDLPSDEGRLLYLYLYLYLLTCPHQNSAGCFWLPDGYACNDVGWEAKRYESARQTLIDADLIQFDEANQAVLIERWFKHNPPMNKSHAMGIEKVLVRCTSPELQQDCHDALMEAWAAKTGAKTAHQPNSSKPSSVHATGQVYRPPG
jgi:hypothetical protein